MTDLKTKGAWIEMLLRMFDSPERGKLQGTPDDFCRMLRCSCEDFNHVINEIRSKKIGDVTISDGIVTVINRRMRKTEKERESAKLRMRNKRVRDGSSDSVTEKLHSPISFSSSSSVTKVTYSSEIGFINLSKNILEKWGAAYPAIDINRELQKAAAWVESNPKNKKSNWERFLNSWLSRAQDKAPPIKEPLGIPPVSTYVTCKDCRREVLRTDLMDVGCIHCAPRKPLSEIMAKIGEKNA